MPKHGRGRNAADSLAACARAFRSLPDGESNWPAICITYLALG
jgi:hypothetical protein